MKPVSQSQGLPKELPPPSSESCVAIVDDFPDLRLLVSRELTRAGCYVRGFPSALHALNYLESHPPFAVMVADERMPGMRGVALLMHVRERWPRTRRVMLSGNPWAIRDDGEAYAHEVLGKGIAMEDLVASIHRHLIAWAKTTSSGGR